MRRQLIAVLIVVGVLLSAAVTGQAATAAVTVLFHFQGGANGTAEVHLQSQEDALPKIKVPDRRGYSFAGYYTAATGNGTQYYNRVGQPTQSRSPTSSLMLYAAWAVQSYPITYENMEGASADTLPQSHTYGNVTAIPDPTKENYTFFGWQVNSSAVSQKNLTLGRYDFSGPITLTAVWNKALLVTTKNNSTHTVDISDADLNKIFNTQVSDPTKGITAFDLNSERVELIMTASDADEQAEGAAQVIALAQGDVMKLYDFSLSKEVLKQGQAAATTDLNEVPTTVQVDIVLTDALAAKTGYRVYRYHSGQAQAIPVGPIEDATGQAESFSVSPDGTSITIHTRRLSTYVVVANTKTVVADKDGTAMDVQAKMVVSSYGPVYRVDLEWGNMRFYYSKDAIWNPDIHAYDENSKFEWQEKLSYENGNNLVRVCNHSNADIMVSMYVTNPQLPGVDIGIYSTNTPNGIAAESMLLSRVPAESAPAPAVDGYVRLSGTPDNWESLTGRPEDNGFTKIAGIAVTISHCNSPLTPQS